MLFKKRRYYRGQFRNPGEVVDVEPLYARAFERVWAAIPAITVAKLPVEEPLKPPAPDGEPPESEEDEPKLPLPKITRKRVPARGSREEDSLQDWNPEEEGD
jgi:hypothetical protein